MASSAVEYVYIIHFCIDNEYLTTVYSMTIKIRAVFLTGLFKTGVL